MDKEFFGYFSIVISLVQYIPYYWRTFRGKVKPHAFSRLIWGTTSAIAFAAQIVDHGGAGTWATGTAAVGSFVITELSLRQGKQDITRGDWCALLFALAAIPLWMLTKNPLHAVLLVTLIDGVGYLPTFRKSWNNPFEESIYAFSIGWTKNILSIVALAHYSAITLTFPLFLAVADAALVMLLLIRRKQLTA